MKLPCILALLLAGVRGFGGDFQPRIDLAGITLEQADASEVRTGKEAIPRKSVALSLGEKTPVHWTLAYTGAKDLTNILVHFYVVKVDRPGRPAVRETKPSAILVENAMSLDLHAKDDAKGEIDLVFRAPGIYLLRLEALSGEESMVSATLDLEVRP